MHGVVRAPAHGIQGREVEVEEQEELVEDDATPELHLALWQDQRDQACERELAE